MRALPELDLLSQVWMLQYDVPACIIVLKYTLFVLSLFRMDSELAFVNFLEGASLTTVNYVNDR